MNFIGIKAMMRKSTKRNCGKRKWGSGSHWQGSFGSASLSWAAETQSMPIRNDRVKVISWNDMFVQTEWDRGIFRLWTKGSAFCVFLEVYG